MLLQWLELEQDYFLALRGKRFAWWCDMKEKELIGKIAQWAKDRNLILGSTPQKQFIKLMEEFGELCAGIARNDKEKIKDSIGDCFVVTVILSKQLDLGEVELYDQCVIGEFMNSRYEHSSTTEQLLEAVHNLGGISIPVSQGWRVNKEWIELFCINLLIISLFEKLSFVECIKYSYDQIKDRKGKMIDGVFVKEEDL